MEMTGTLKFKDRYMTELSGGERQLVFIARALTQEPEIILLDEPITHLDISHQVRVLDIVKTLITQKGLTAITVLHDLNLASEYCDRLLLLNNGRVHSIGLPSEILTYQAIEEVYKTTVIVKENPLSKKPYVFVVPNAGIKRYHFHQDF
jgi:iron complex transport system ATP-binding protein